MSQLPRLADRLSQHADPIKGALILAVVADHNDWLRGLMPRLFNPLTFHVLGFFLLAFTFGSKEWTRKFVADRVARYLIPYWWALLTFTMAYIVMYRANVGPLDLALKFGLALVIGNAPFVKASSGLIMLWFLPALFGVTCLLAFYDSILSIKAKTTFWVMLATAHLAIPFFPRMPLLVIPFGLAIAVDIFVLGLIWRWLMTLRISTYLGPIACIVFVVCYGVLVHWNNHLEIGTLVISEMRNPVVMILSDVSSLAAILALIWLCEWFRPMRWLTNIGRNSLLVYLIHPVCYVVLSRVWPSADPAGQSQWGLLFSGLMTVFIALVGAYAMSLVITRSPILVAWITPKSWSEWEPVRRLRG